MNTTTSSNSHIDALLTKSRQLLENGDAKAATDLCRSLLKEAPDHSEAIYLLGLIAYRSGDVKLAETCFNRAIVLRPGHWEYYKGLANVLKTKGVFGQAISCFEKALELNPEDKTVFYDMGCTFHVAGEFKKAIYCYGKAVQADEGYADAYNNMGLALDRLGMTDDAVLSFQKALCAKPDFAACRVNLGNILKRRHQPEAALDLYKSAIQLQPEFAEAWANMGSAFQQQGLWTDAISCFHKALELNPDLTDLLISIGNVYQEMEHYEKAISFYRKAQPFFAESEKLWLNLGMANRELNRPDHAISCFRKALDIQPDYEKALSSLVSQLRYACDWEALKTLDIRLDRLTRLSLKKEEVPCETPFLNIMRHKDPAFNVAVARAWSREIEKKTIQRKKNRPVFNPARSGKIRVGYLSDNFKNHPTAHLISGLIELHDRDRFSVFCYATNKDDKSLERKTIKGLCDGFVALDNVSDMAAADRIYEDKINILVDLVGHTRGARLAIPALRPAPVQVRFMGMAGTTGADFFDYLITDRIVTPEKEQPFYSEKFVFMPHTYQVNAHMKNHLIKNRNKGGYGLFEDRFVLCAFNTAYKIDAGIFACWVRILKKAPNTVLWLLDENNTIKRNWIRAAKKQGVNENRFVFAEKLSRENHLERLQYADLSLDTVAVNGAATTSDALWAGTPVLTVKGRHFASRMSESILAAVGMEQLVAEDAGQYEAIAVKLATDEGFYKKTKDRLLKNRSEKPLFDTHQYVAELEKAYLKMWEDYKSRQMESPIITKGLVG